MPALGSNSWLGVHGAVAQVNPSPTPSVTVRLNPHAGSSKHDQGMASQISTSNAGAPPRFSITSANRTRSPASTPDRSLSIGCAANPSDVMIGSNAGIPGPVSHGSLNVTGPGTSGLNCPYPGTNGSSYGIAAITPFVTCSSGSLSVNSAIAIWQ